MAIAFVVGAIWIMVSVVVLWLNYRFHHFLPHKEQALVLDNSLMKEDGETEGQLELQFSKSC